jgi:tetratricopeptide (TPR) repeat protein
MKNYWLLAFGCFLLVILTGCGAEQAMKKGDKYYALGEYYDAAAQYKKAYSQTPAKERALRGKRALKMAESYRRINYTQKAIAAYNNAVRYKQTDSLTYLHLAEQLMKSGNYKEAAKNYQTALDSIKSYAFKDSRSYEQQAKAGLRSAQKAPIWKEEGSRYIVKRENFFN